MQVSVENTSQLGRRLIVEISDLGLDQKVKERLQKEGQKIRLKGFRPGKVPPKLIEQRFSASVRSELIEGILKDSFPKAITEQDLKPAGTPVIDELKEENDKLRFVASFEVYPEITLADLSAVEVKTQTATVTDADVNKMVEKIKLQFCDWDAVERPAKVGDKLMVDISRQLLDGHHPEPIEQNNVALILNQEGMLPGLVEAVVGKKAGDKAIINLTYPEDWPDSHDAGLEVKIDLTIHSVSEQKPMTNLELAEKMKVVVTEGESLESKMLENIRERLLQQVAEAMTVLNKEIILEVLIEKNPLVLPVALIDEEKESIIREYEHRLKNNEHVHFPEEAELTEMAEKRVLLGLLINKVVEEHKLTIPEAKVRIEAEKLAMQFGASAKEIVAYYLKNPNLRKPLERKILLEEAIEVLLKQVKLNEKQVSVDDLMKAAAAS